MGFLDVDEQAGELVFLHRFQGLAIPRIRWIARDACRTRRQVRCQRHVHPAHASDLPAKFDIAGADVTVNLVAEAVVIGERLGERLALLVDQTARALAQALAGYDGLGDQIYRHVGSRDVSFGGKVRSMGRAEVALATHLAAVSGCVSRNPNDPRDGQTLEAMETEQLARLLIDPEKAEEIASMDSGGEPESQPEPRAA